MVNGDKRLIIRTPRIGLESPIILLFTIVFKCRAKKEMSCTIYTYIEICVCNKKKYVFLHQKKKYFFVIFFLVFNVFFFSHLLSPKRLVLSSLVYHIYQGLESQLNNWCWHLYVILEYRNSTLLLLLHKEMRKID